jgi:peroxiredoxin
MNKWAKDQDLTNVTVILDGSGEFTRKTGMIVDKDNLGFGMRYAAIVKDGVIEAWSEEPGLCDNHGDDPYGVSAQETLQQYLEQKDVEKAA